MKVDSEQRETMERETVAAEAPPAASRRSRTMLFGAVILIIIAIAGFALWSYYSVRESTDDAQIEGHIHPISAKVGGTVTAVHFIENRYVEAGTVLVQIDPKDYEIALARAQADLAEAEATLQGSRISVPITATTTTSEVSTTQAGVEEARANVASSEKEVGAAEAKIRAAEARVQESQANYQKAQRDLDRMKALVAKDEVSQQQYDYAVANAASMKAALESTQADVAAAQQALQVARSHVQRDQARVAVAEAQSRAAGTGPQQLAITRSRAASAQARVDMAKAAVQQAELNLQYGTIRAPISGIVSRKSVEVGQIVQPGQPLFAIVPLTEIWVMANFKETQLNRIKPGQPVTVEVDAYGGREYKGHVDSIAAATGAKFSLLPPENATGNYVKVVQRIPVKILLEQGEDPEHLLRPGMSVVPTIYTK
jgi:membrane fusion protein, multidrug efflux system